MHTLILMHIPLPPEKQCDAVRKSEKGTSRRDVIACPTSIRSIDRSLFAVQRAKLRRENAGAAVAVVAVILVAFKPVAI